jgi:Tfp pilus assembly PilM family ATPase
MYMRFGSMHKKSGVGLTIGPGFVTMVRIARSGSGPVVETAVTRPIPEPRGEEEVAAVLRALVAEEKVRGVELNVAVPRNEITTRVITLPSTDPREIHQMARLEVEEFVPYSSDELEVDEAILEQLPDGSSKVLVAIAHKDVVDRVVALLAKADVGPAYVGVSCFALFNAFMFGTKPSPTGAAALLDVNDFGTDILVTEGGAVSFTRGVAHLRAASATPEEIAAELRNSLETYSRQTGGKTVERVLLSGAVERPDEFARRLGAIVGLEVVEADFVERACEIQDQGSRYAVQVGLALSALQQPALDLNLIPRRMLERTESQRKRKAGLFATALGCLVLIMAYLVVNSKLADKRNYIRFLDGQIARMEQPAQLVKEKKARVDTISRQLSRRNSALEVLGEIHRLAPEGLVVEEVRFVRDKNVSISGQCYDREIAFEFAKRLRGSGVEALARAELGSTRDQKVENVPVIRFEIDAPMSAAERVEVEVETPLEEG